MAYLIVVLLVIPAGIVSQGWFLPFVVWEFADRPLWQCVIMAWLLPGVTVDLFALGLLVLGQRPGRVPRGSRRWLVGQVLLISGVVLLPVAFFAFLASFAKQDFLAPTAFQQAEHTPTGAAWQAGFMAAMGAPIMWAFLLISLGWLRTRWHSRHVAFRNVVGEWSTRTRWWFGLTVAAAPWVGLVWALASRP